LPARLTRSRAVRQVVPRNEGRVTETLGMGDDWNVIVTLPEASIREACLDVRRNAAAIDLDQRRSDPRLA